MTNRERIIRAINHQESDFVPYEIGFTQQARDNLEEYPGDKSSYEKLDPPMSRVYYDGWPKETVPGSGYFKDDFGVVWNRNSKDKDIGVIEGYVIKEPILEGYAFPPIDEMELRNRFEDLAQTGKNQFTFGCIGFSMFERAWSLVGMENLLVYMIEEPDFVHQLLDAIADFNIRIMDIAFDYAIDGFMFGDDWGQQKGLIMGPVLWREFIKPRMKRMYARAKREGKYLIQHSCGDIHEIFPDLIEIGLDVYQTFQPEIYDIKKIKAQYGDRLSFWGGISTQQLLPFASPEEIKRVTRETMQILGVNGGYIAAPAHAIPGDVPPENILAMISAMQNQ